MKSTWKKFIAAAGLAYGLLPGVSPLRAEKAEASPAVHVLAVNSADSAAAARRRRQRVEAYTNPAARDFVVQNRVPDLEKPYLTGCQEAFGAVAGKNDRSIYSDIVKCTQGKAWEARISAATPEDAKRLGASDVSAQFQFQCRYDLGLGARGKIEDSAKIARLGDCIDAKQHERNMEILKDAGLGAGALTGGGIALAGISSLVRKRRRGW